MNAVVYSRYSSHKQGEQSIEGQLASAYQFAAEHGYTIIHEYVDRAQTGRNDDREQFQQMLKDTAKRQFEAIIIWKIDRFGRNREEIAFNKYRCKKNGVKVLYTAESIPNTPERIVLEAVLEGMAEYYSVQLATNVKRGMDIAASKGQSVGGTIPLEYRTGADKHSEPDPATALLVKRMLAQNRKAPAKKWTKAEYLLTGKLFCGLSGIFNDATKARMEELDVQRGELEAALADAELVSGPCASLGIISNSSCCNSVRWTSMNRTASGGSLTFS